MYHFQRSVLFIISISCLLTGSILGQIKDPVATEVWDPTPRVVTPGQDASPPSDALILFDGKDGHQWSHADGSPIKWVISDGIMTVRPGTGPIFTKEKFGDCQLHIEWRAPAVIEGEGQGRGNSGVFLQNRYEVQILDSYDNGTYSNGQAGSIYKQAIPLVNAMQPPGKWNTYDIIYKAPRFNDDGIKVAPAYVTVLHNGILIQDHFEVKGSTEYIGLPKYIAHGDDVIQLQDHANPVSYRQIWIRRL